MPFRRIAKLGGFELFMFVNPEFAQKIRASVFWPGAKDIAVPPQPPTNHRQTTSSLNISPEVKKLLERVSQIDWYHTFDLGQGVTTPGAFDHSLELSTYQIPNRLDGLRALDIATYDGYWAFEFERRGAAEVVAIDVGSTAELDLPQKIREKIPAEELARKTGAGFELMKEILKSKVKRQVLSVYDLSPERLGKFDFVFCGDLLLHLMTPMRALEKIRSVVSGHAVLVEAYNPFLPGRTVEYRGGSRRCVWWSFSLDCLEQMIRDAGFSDVTLASTFKTGHRGDKSSLWRAAFTAAP